MKNLIALTDKQEIHDYCFSLWKSDEFRLSHINRGFIYTQIERFAWLPRLFCETTNDYLERAHFSTWWNIIMKRSYDNPIISDLYYIHEICHASTMPYVPFLGRAAFIEKMQRNELEASVLSEIQIYFEMPGLRESSFDHPIYADRFLDNPDIKAMWVMNREVTIETIRTMRRDVMVSKPEHDMDLSEVWIRKFSDQNAAHMIVWADTYQEIEREMAGLQSYAAFDRADAIKRYQNWIEGQATLDSHDHIPFRREAELFAPFYWANKEKYARAIHEASEEN